jgi:hypothetical protein
LSLSTHWAKRANSSSLRKRRFGFGVATVLLALATTMGPASAGSQTTAGDGSAALDSAALWFQGQREAPNNYVNPAAYAALAGQAAGLPTAPGSWIERTPGNYFTDSPTYAPVGANCGANCFQNSGSGERYVSGRMTSVVVTKSGVIFAGGADSGIWKSTNRGAKWTAVGDHLGTMSIGALLIDNDAGSSYTIYAGTGEANTSSDSYAGIGVLKSTDGGTSWTSLPTTAVNTDGSVSTSDLAGALSFRLLRNGIYLYAATSHGLFRINPSADTRWTRVLQFDGQYAGGNTIPANLRVWDMITDVVALPGTGHLLAAAGWRGGEPTNGLYESVDAGSTYTHIANPNGWVPASAQGRVSLARSADGSTLVAIIQSASTFVKPNASGSILAGVYESNSGASGPWNQIASPGKLSSSGSAEAKSAMRGYKPGVQAWYNQFLAVDPANSNHIYLGLEEVYETTNGGTSWNTLGPYWNLTLSCFAYTPFEGTCNHHQTHPDQHAVFLDTASGRNTLFVGNDGGMWSKSMSDHTQGNWTDLNNTMDTLQYYSAAGSNDGSLYGGMQDNGSSLTFPAPTTVVGDAGSPVAATSVQVFGGDGGYTIVDPNNSNNAITEYVGLTSAYTHDGGKTWVGNQPGDPNARFIAPIVRDYTTPVVNGNAHILAGGRYVWDSTRGFNTATSDWSNIYDLSQGGLYPSRQATAIGTATVNRITTTWAAWCGPCNPNGAGNGFQSGVVVLNNAGGAYHVVASYATGGTSGLPGRYITGVFVNPTNANEAHASFSGYSRNWYVGALDSGVGHVFDLTAGTVTPETGNLIDSPTNDIVVVNGDLIVGTDFGVYASKDNGATWSRLGANLPNAVIGQLTVSGTQILAATHGRGLWTFPVASLP